MEPEGVKKKTLQQMHSLPLSFHLSKSHAGKNMKENLCQRKDRTEKADKTYFSNRDTVLVKDPYTGYESSCQKTNVKSMEID